VRDQVAGFLRGRTMLEGCGPAGHSSTGSFLGGTILRGLQSGRTVLQGVSGAGPWDRVVVGQDTLPLSFRDGTMLRGCNRAGRCYRVIPGRDHITGLQSGGTMVQGCDWAGRCYMRGFSGRDNVAGFPLGREDHGVELRSGSRHPFKKA
jgi:hypothetical protein